MPQRSDNFDIKMFLDENILTAPNYREMSAWTEHVPFTFWLIAALKPRLYVELGTKFGISYFAACQKVDELGLNSRCFAVDTWLGDEHAGFYSEEVFKQVHDHNERNYARFSVLLRMRFDQALDEIDDETVDLLHIYGRHFYEGVKSDFEAWIPKLTDRSIVMFHDTEIYERGFGCWKFWQELENKYPSFNFLHGHGLGVIAFGENIASPLADFFAASTTTSSANRARDIFSTFGRKHSKNDELAKQAIGIEQLEKDLEERQVQIATLNHALQDMAHDQHLAQ